MGRLQRTASTTASVGSLTADAGTPRRTKTYELICGSEAAPADNAFLYQLQRCTAAGTATGVTPTALDPADAAALSDFAQNHTVEPTYTASQFLLDLAINQRSTFRWLCSPGSELVTPATAANGYGIATPTATAVAITVTVLFEEQ